jgi:hypothetical protein
MKIAFEKLEAVIMFEAVKPRIYTRNQPDILDEAFPALYLAAKYDGIELLDLLIASRNHEDMTRVIAMNFLTHADIDLVKRVTSVLDNDVPEYVNRIRENYVLDDWLKANAR